MRRTHCLGCLYDAYKYRRTGKNLTPELKDAHWEIPWRAISGMRVITAHKYQTLRKTESSPYNYVYKWYKSQMDAAKAEKQDEKKTSAPGKEDLMNKLNALTAGISFNDVIDEEIGLEEEEA